MDRRRLLELMEPMLCNFKAEIARLRSAGSTQAEIEEMIDKFEKVHAGENNAEGALIIAILREAARLLS